MTMEEIDHIRYINKETEKIQDELYELKTTDFYRGNIFVNLEDNIRPDEDIKMLEGMLSCNLELLQTERKKIEKFIASVEDSEMGLIIQLRSVNNMSWEEIGAELGIDKTTVSKKFYKFFKK